VKKILLATNNEGKKSELQRLLDGTSFEIVSLTSLENMPEAREDGFSFAENARKKALHYYELSGLSTIADDSGLEVDALGGEPGIHSARYASSDQNRTEKLLRNLRQLEPAPVGAERSARFVCAICVVLSPEQMIEVSACVEGLITIEPKGENGFGYDPIFYYPPFNKTFAEVDPDQKNRVSHRGKALTKLKIELCQ